MRDNVIFIVLIILSRNAIALGETRESVIVHGLNEYKQRSNDLTYDYTESSVANNVEKLIAKATLSRMGDKVLFRHQFTNSERPGVMGLNEYYAFWLRTGQINGQWHLKLLDEDAPDIAIMRNEIATRSYMVFSSPCALFVDVDYSELFSDSNKVNCQRRRVSEDDRHITYFFKYTKYFHVSKVALNYESQVTFDKTNHFSLLKADTTCLNPSKGAAPRSVTELTYSNDIINGIRPLSKYVSSDYYGNDTQPKSYNICNIVSARKSSDKDIYFIKHYGLPEPVSAPRDLPNATRTWAVLLWASLIMAIVAALLCAIGRRGRTIHTR